MDEGFDDMTESEFDAAFYGDDEDTASVWAAFNCGPKGSTCNPARISLTSFTGSPGITLDGA